MSSVDNTPEYGLETNFTLNSNLPRNCPRCGITNPPGTTFCECGYNFAVPAVPAGTTAVVVGAGFWIRALARLIDSVVGLILGRFSGYAGSLILIALQLFNLVRPGWPMRILQERMLMIPFSLVGVVLYHTACEGIYGATPGKFFCGLRVLSEDLKPCGLKAGLVRSLAYFIDALIFGLVAYFSMNKTSAQQRHGDHWAHTVVVKNAEVPQESKRSEFRLFGALVAGICAWGVMLIAGLVVAAL